MLSIRLHVAFRRPDEIDVVMLANLLSLTSALVRISHAPLLSSLSKVCASAHETHAAAFVSFNGARMGSCTLEAVALSEEGVQMRSGATLRPLLKALIVSQARHQGVGTLRVDDAAAHVWGRPVDGGS